MTDTTKDEQIVTEEGEGLMSNVDRKRPLSQTTDGLPMPKEKLFLGRYPIDCKWVIVIGLMFAAVMFVTLIIIYLVEHFSNSEMSPQATSPGMGRPANATRCGIFCRLGRSISSAEDEEDVHFD